MDGSSYQSSNSRDPIWTRVAGDPKYTQPSRQHDRVQQGAGVSSMEVVKPNRKQGLSVLATAIFISGEMAGSGVLALPRAVVDSGWIGLILIVVFCFNAGFGGCRLGICWSMLEERYPEYREPIRNPYATIALRAVGPWGKCLVSACIQITLFGAATVYLLLASQLVRELVEDVVPSITYCVWLILLAVLLCPAMWLGSPKDFWAVGIGALLTTTIACVFLLTQIIIDGGNNTQPVEHKPHGSEKFFLSFGTILFAFGGASTFPTIQNDMQDKTQFPKCVIIAFSIILVLFFPICTASYFVYGDAVDTNIALTVSKTTIVLIANFLMAFHLILAFLIIVNPVSQELEQIFNVPTEFHWKRSLLRTLMICLMVLIGESVPSFGKILALVGGSTITLLTFVLPSLFYMRLCDQKHADWPERPIPTYIRIYLWELIIIGLAGGAAATYSAFQAIFGEDSVTVPCYLRS